MKQSKNNNIILGFGYWVFEFGFSWCKGKVKGGVKPTFLGVFEDPKFKKCQLNIIKQKGSLNLSM